MNDRHQASLVSRRSEGAVRGRHRRLASGPCFGVSRKEGDRLQAQRLPLLQPSAPPPLRPSAPPPLGRVALVSTSQGLQTARGATCREMPGSLRCCSAPKRQGGGLGWPGVRGNWLRARISAVRASQWQGAWRGRPCGVRDTGAHCTGLAPPRSRSAGGRPALGLSRRLF